MRNKEFKNVGGGATPLGSCSKGFESQARGMCLFDDALTSGSAKRHIPPALNHVTASVPLDPPNRKLEKLYRGMKLARVLAIYVGKRY